MGVTKYSKITEILLNLHKENTLITLDLRTFQIHLNRYVKIFISPVILLIFFSSPVFSQEYEHVLFTSNMLVEGRFYYGFLYAQHIELERFNGHFPVFELNLLQETYGKRKWERTFSYPDIGMSFLYTGLDKSHE